MIKLSGLTTEKKELGGALINKIERFTDRNYHTEARMELAKAVGDKKLVDANTRMAQLDAADSTNTRYKVLEV